MRFIDEALIKVSGGHGGPGCISFRRETFAPRGGPDGGDGGAGGDVIFEACKQLGTLQDFRFKRNYAAPAGNHGSGANKAGRDGESLTVKIPVGTIIKDAETDEVLVDFVSDKQQWVAAEGGRGGKGNAHFVSSTFQAPKFAQPGEAGTARQIRLELKLLADVAIIGFPNAGKSTLISKVSAAHPKVADYPFTTLTPNLGVVSFGEKWEPGSRTAVFADVPGLIEGAHKGMGLGTRFLKHIERTRVFLHLLDGQALLEEVTVPGLSEEDFNAAIDGFAGKYAAIRKELELFNEALLHKTEIVAVNKAELLDSDPTLIERVRVAIRDRIGSNRAAYSCPLTPEEPYFISAATGGGLKTLLGAVERTLGEIPRGSSRGGGAHGTDANDPTSGVMLPDNAAIRR